MLESFDEIEDLKILSWNVNGLRAAIRKGFMDWLADDPGHIIGVQEIKALTEQLDDEIVEPERWHAYYHSAERKGYSGVAMFSRFKADEVETDLGEARFNEEGRLQLAKFGELTVANVYFPNGSGKNRDLSRIPYKLDFYDALRERLQPLVDEGERILVMGDFNTAREDIDLARPKQNVKTSGFRPEERENLELWFEAGWVDSFRHIHGPVEERYSWWSNRKGIRERNVGWRIDYVLASPGALEFVRDADIHHDIIGSDHCPVSITLDPKVTG